MIVTAVVVVWAASGSGQKAVGTPRAAAKFTIPAEPISIATSNIRGSSRSKIALVEFSDFQCPFCGRFVRDTYPALDAEYIQTGKVLFVFQQFPLPNHQRAVPAAIAAVCAGRQGKFWSMHDSLFQDQTRFDDEDLFTRAKKLGLVRSEFSACFGSQAVKPEIDAAIAQARALGLRNTPVFLAGTVLGNGSVQVVKFLLGARPIEDFREMLDALLRPQ